MGLKPIMMRVTMNAKGSLQGTGNGMSPSSSTKSQDFPEKARPTKLMKTLAALKMRTLFARQILQKKLAHTERAGQVLAGQV